MLGGETHAGAGAADTLRYLKFILEARGNAEDSEKETRWQHLGFRQNTGEQCGE